MLEKGKRYRYPDGETVEVLMVNECRALVRPVGTRRVEYETHQGRLVSFDAPHLAYSISPRSVLEEAP